ALLDEAVAASRGCPAVKPYRLAHALMDVGRYRLGKGATECAPLFAEAARVRRQALGSTQIGVAQALAFEAPALRREGKAQEAEAPHREAEQILRQHTRDENEARRARVALAGELPAWP